jgi:hypothetical protein
LDETELIVDLVVMIGVEPDLLGVERLGAVNIRNRDVDHFQLHLHILISSIRAV